MPAYAILYLYAKFLVIGKIGCTCTDAGTVGLELAIDPLPPGGILYTIIF